MNIFVTGAAGYIGGSIAARLIEQGHAVRGLVRDSTKAVALERLGITPVIGTLEDAALLSAEARRADAVINAASSDNAVPLGILLDALAGSDKPFIHTSGSSVVGDDARGEWASERVYTEETPVPVVPEKMKRAALDQLIRDAAGRGVRSVILCNTMIYGDGLGVKRDSVQIPPLVEQARESGIARHVGKGLNVWSNVHVSDVADLYALALAKAPAGSYFYVENGEAAYRDISSAIATRLGLGEAQDWPIEDAIARWGAGHAIYSFGSNSRVNADKARRELGWKPKHASVTSWIINEMTLD